MYRSPMLNKTVIPVLAFGSLAYAVYATGVMRPRFVSEPPLSAPPERTYPRAVAAVGLVEPASELVAVAPRVPGWIQAVHVAAGQTVKSGDPLFTLDGTELRAELLLREQAASVAEARLTRLRASPRPEDIPIARAALAEAQAKLADAKDKLRRVESTDSNAVSEEERSQRRQAVAREEAATAARQAELDRLLAGAWKEDIAVAESELGMARAATARTRADIDRLTTYAPIDAIILRVTARAGQYAPVGGAGALAEPLVTLGSPGPLHVRADVNEEDVPRVTAGASATAMVRGGAVQKIPLEFVRIEPLVTPKKAFSGFAEERVDTRVMQIIFRISPPSPNVLVGQQVDIFINEAVP